MPPCCYPARCCPRLGSTRTPRASGWPARIPPAGRRLAPQRTDRRGGWGRAACTAGAARGEALAQGSHASPPMRHVRGDVRRSRRRQRRSGGGPGEGCLADTGRGNGRWVYRTFQRLEDLPDDLPVRHGREHPQHPPLTPGAARHSECKHALEQSCPGPARGPGVRRLLVYALLSWRGDDRSTQVAVGRQTAAIAHQVDARQGG